MAKYIDEELLIEKMTRLRGCSCYYSDGIIDEVEDIMSDISTEDVIENAKIDKAIEEMERYSTSFEYANRHDLASVVDCCIGMIQKNIGEKK